MAAMRTGETTPRAYRQGWLAFALAVVTLGSALAYMAPRWEPYRWINRDGTFYYNVSLGLLENGTLRQNGWHPESWFQRDMGWNHDLDAAFSNVALGRDGHTLWPKHPWLLPVAAAPFVFAAGPWGALVLNTLLLLAMVLVAHRLARWLAPPWAAFAAAALFATSAAATSQAWSLSNDLFYTVFALAAFEAALAERPFRAGLLLGVGVVAKVTVVLLVPALFLGPVWRRDGRSLVRMVAGLAGPAAVTMAVNAWMFGNPLVVGYERVLVMVDGVAQLHPHGTDFAWGRLGPALRHALWTTFQAFPAWPLAGVGAYALARRKRLPAVAALGAGILIVTLFHAPFAWFRTGFMLPALGLSVPLLAAAFSVGRAPRADSLPRQPGRRALAVATGALALLLVVGGVRRLAAAPPDSLADRVRDAEVHLGGDPCDYFNHQVSGWECAGQDRGGDARLMTGALVSPKLHLDGPPGPWVRLSPHPSGRPRTISWAVPPDAHGVRVTYGLEAGSRGTVHFVVRTDAGTLLDTRATSAVEEVLLPLPEGASTLTFAVFGRRPMPFGFDGRFEGRTSP